jgi:hypothetical protein
MRKILIALLISMTLFSCSNNESEIKESITNKIKENLKNPDSFEFVSMNIKSTISVDDVKKRINLKSLNEFKKLINAESSQEYKDFLTQFEKNYNFIENYTGPKNEAEYYVTFVAKGTNSFGAIIQSSYEAHVLNDDDKTTLSVTEIEK